MVMLLPKDQRSGRVSSRKNNFSHANALSFKIRKLYCHKHKHLQLQNIHTAYYIIWHTTTYLKKTSNMASATRL